MIDHIDHFVLTSTNEQATVWFYSEVLGMQVEEFGNGRKAFKFGSQKINLHLRGHEIEPKAHLPVPGSLDICLITITPLDEVIQHLERKAVAIVEGPVQRTGANGPIRSVYLRDPDLNLVEISEYL